MENYTIEQFHEDVRAEATALKSMAMPEELAKLDMHLLDPQSPQECIYGLMTGDCMSPRASNLIFGCCKRYFKPSFEEDDMESVLRHANGVTIEGVIDGATLKENRGSGEWNIAHFSAVETYIMTEDANIENLIAFLKGETDTLEL